jgi:hypothetical protein
MADTQAPGRVPDDATAGASYEARIRELRDAAGDLEALLGVLVANCDRVVSELDDGLTPLDSVRSVGDEASRTFRRDVHKATTRFAKAMQASRGASLRVLVRDGGISVAELSRQMGLSAQMVRRLLRIAEGA